MKCRVYLKISMININCVKELNEVLTRNVFVRHGSLAEWNSLVRGLPILGSGYRIRIHPCFRASEVLHSIQFIKIYLNNVKKNPRIYTNLTMFMPCFDFKYTEASYKLCDVTLHFSFMIINIFRIKQYLKSKL